MKHPIVLGFAFILLISGIGLAQSSTEIYGASPDSPVSTSNGLVAETPGNEVYSSMAPAEDTFATYVFTLNDVLIFSYEDNTFVEVRDDNNGLVWSGTLSTDQYKFINAGNGVFLIRGDKKYSVLVGDPTTELVQGWYAVDQNNRGVSNKFLTVTPGAWDASKTVVFAYHDDTEVEIRDVVFGNILATGTIDSAGHLALPSINSEMAHVVAVTGSNPVSVLSYGDQGFWVPSSNGSFSGKLFYTWVGFIGSWQNDLNLMAYHDNTHVRVATTNTNDLIWEGDLDQGEIQTLAPMSMYVTIESDKNITCLVAPFVSFAGAYARLYDGIDASGQGIGTQFYHPTISGSAMYVFSFYDNNNVRMVDQKSGSVVWSGVLNSGEYHLEHGSNKLYRFESDRGIALFDAVNEIAGAIFAPLWFAVHPEVAVLPLQEEETEPAVPVRYELSVENNGNTWDIVNIHYRNTQDPDFVTVLTDSVGGDMPDVDSDGYPDTDTLAEKQRFLMNSEVTPGQYVPFGTIDTCYVSVISSLDPAKTDTVPLVTIINEVEIRLDSSRTIAADPGDTVEFIVNALSTMQYREQDTINLVWSDSKSSPDWPVMVTHLDGSDLTDHDADGGPDLPDIQRFEEPSPFMVRVGVPLSASAGDQIVVTVTGTSVDFPPAYYPVGDTAILTVNVSAIPALEVAPDTVDSIESGYTVRYPMRALNWGNGEDVLDITLDPGRSDWTYRLVASDGIGDLTDTDSDGVPDVGSVSGVINETIPGVGNFFLDVTPPSSAREEDIDVTYVHATSSVDNSVTDSARVVTYPLFPLLVGIDIEEDSEIIIGSGETATYDLYVINNGRDPDTISIGTNPLPLGFPSDWFSELTFADGSSLLDLNQDDIPDLGSVDVNQRVDLRLVVSPPAELGSIIGNIDTTVVDQRYIWIQTGYISDTLVRDSVLITTIFEPILDIHNYPNPFSGSTNFVYTIPRAGKVSLTIYNRAGEHIHTLIADEDYETGGVFEIAWDGRSEDGNQVSPGVYLYVLVWRELEDDDGYASARRIVKKALVQP